MSLPNLLTASRLVLAPVFIVFFLIGRGWASLVALGLAITFEVTDLLDGWAARKLDQVSSLGKLIDPMADSICRFSVFLAFITEQSVRTQPWPVLLVALVFYRDALVAYTRVFAASRGVVLAARVSGKVKALVQGTGIIAFLAFRSLGYYYEPLAPWRATALYVVLVPIVLVTTWSAFDYVSSNWGIIAGMAGAEDQEH